jgi:hypothetical protein
MKMTESNHCQSGQIEYGYVGMLYESNTSYKTPNVHQVKLH